VLSDTARVSQPTEITQFISNQALSNAEARWALESAFALVLSVALIAPATAQTWYCEPSRAYYPQVQTCAAPWRAMNQPQTPTSIPPDWYCRTNPAVCQYYMNLRQQEQTAHTAQIEAESARRTAEIEAANAKQAAEIEAQKAVARAKRVEEARIAAENSPNNICRNPGVAHMLISEFNEFDWYDGRKAVDIEHLVTKSYTSENSMSCYGTWVLNHGQRINGTMTTKPNVAGDIIAEWKAENWEPSVVETPTALVPAPPTQQTTSAFQDGVRDRQTWEQWFNSLSGDEREGAFYWAGQRSLKNPGSCNTLEPAKIMGCKEAQTKLAPTDVRRKSEPDFRAGWNSIQAPAS
jgi:hypothetical protein